MFLANQLTFYIALSYIATLEHQYDTVFYSSFDFRLYSLSGLSAGFTELLLSINKFKVNCCELWVEIDRIYFYFTNSNKKVSAC